MAVLVSSSPAPWPVIPPPWWSSRPLVAGIALVISPALAVAVILAAALCPGRPRRGRRAAALVDDPGAQRRGSAALVCTGILTKK